MQYLLWGNFLAVSLLHLWACGTKRTRLMYTSKGFILLSLIMCVVLLSQTIDRLFLLALVFCLVGDILLIPRRTFVAGGISFFFAHLMFILSYQRHIDLARFPLWFAVLSTGAAAALSLSTLAPVFKKEKGPLALAASGYLLSVCLHSAAAAAMMCTLRTTPSLLVWLGTLSFLVSDCMIVHRQFKIREFAGFRFWIMLTYIAAVGFITGGYLAIISPH